MTDLTSAAAAAAVVLGEEITAPVALAGGSDRSVVLRGRAASGRSVVVKSYPPTDAGTASFAAEAAGLGLVSGSGLAPELLGTDPARRLIVMTDLGTAPSLADLLLGSSPDAAAAALRAWAQGCGTLALRTAGRQGEFADLLAAYRTQAGDSCEVHWLERRIREIPGLLASLSLRVPAGLDADLGVLAALARPGEYQVFSPGDICPDNNLVTPDGVRFIDFEDAGFHSVFLDAAYLRMPFSTCWCVFRLPAQLAQAAEAAYRSLVAQVYPDLASDGTWRAGTRRAMAAWTLHALTYLLDRSLSADRSMAGDDPVLAPTARQLLRYRWEGLRAELAPAGDLPAIAAMLDGLLAATESWQAAAMPGYPAFG